MSSPNFYELSKEQCAQRDPEVTIGSGTPKLVARENTITPLCKRGSIWPHQIVQPQKALHESSNTLNTHFKSTRTLTCSQTQDVHYIILQIVAVELLLKWLVTTAPSRQITSPVQLCLRSGSEHAYSLHLASASRKKYASSLPQPCSPCQKTSSICHLTFGRHCIISLHLFAAFNQFPPCKKLLSALIWRTCLNPTICDSCGLLLRYYLQKEGHRACLPPTTHLSDQISLSHLKSAHAFSAEQCLLPLPTLLLILQNYLTLLLSLVELGLQWWQRHPQIFNYSCCSTSKAPTTAKDLDSSWNPKAQGGVPRAERKEQSSFVRIKLWTGNGSK